MSYRQYRTIEKIALEDRTKKILIGTAAGAGALGLGILAKKLIARRAMNKLIDESFVDINKAYEDAISKSLDEAKRTGWASQRKAAKKSFDEHQREIMGSFPKGTKFYQSNEYNEAFRRGLRRKR